MHMLNVAIAIMARVCVCVCVPSCVSAGGGVSIGYTAHGEPWIGRMTIVVGRVLHRAVRKSPHGVDRPSQATVSARLGDQVLKTHRHHSGFRINTHTSVTQSRGQTKEVDRS